MPGIPHDVLEFLDRPDVAGSFPALQAWMWVLFYERGGRAGVGPPTGLRRIPATLVVAEQHSLSPESNPSRAPIRRPVAASTLAPLLPPAPPGAVGLLFGPRRTHVPTPPMTSSKPETFREGTAGRAPALAAQDKWADESLQSSTFMPGAPI